MNALLGMSGNKPETMTSQEISDLLNKRHDKVKQSIERLADRGTIQRPPLGEVKNRLGQTVEVFQINERDSYVVVAQLSPEFTARLVDYWQAHKNQTAQIPTTAEAFAQAFRLLADAEARDAQRDQRMNLMDARIEHVERTTSLPSKPQQCETKSEAKARMNKQYGLKVRDLETIAQCAVAIQELEAEISNIGSQMSKVAGGTMQVGNGWKTKAEMAKCWKKRTLKAVIAHANTIRRVSIGDSPADSDLNSIILQYLEAQKVWEAQFSQDCDAAANSAEWDRYMSASTSILDFQCRDMTEIRHKAQFILSEENLVDMLANCSTDAAVRDFLGSMILPVDKSNSGEN